MRFYSNFIHQVLTLIVTILFSTASRTVWNYIRPIEAQCKLYSTPYRYYSKDKSQIRPQITNKTVVIERFFAIFCSSAFFILRNIILSNYQCANNNDRTFHVLSFRSLNRSTWSRLHPDRTIEVVSCSSLKELVPYFYPSFSFDNMPSIVFVNFLLISSALLRLLALILHFSYYFGKITKFRVGHTPYSQMAHTWAKLVPSHESKVLEDKQKLQMKTFSELAECLARIPRPFWLQTANQY